LPVRDVVYKLLGRPNEKRLTKEGDAEEEAQSVSKVSGWDDGSEDEDGEEGASDPEAGIVVVVGVNLGRRERAERRMGSGEGRFGQECFGR
jgi:hypothetical protein